MRKKNHPLWNQALGAVVKEVRCYADGIVQTINHADFLPNKNRLVKEAKKNLQDFLKKIQKSHMANKAINLASHKGSQVLSMLNVPTKKDVAKLNSRVASIEKRLKTLRGKRAGQRAGR